MFAFPLISNEGFVSRDDGGERSERGDDAADLGAHCRGKEVAARGDDDDRGDDDEAGRGLSRGCDDDEPLPLENDEDFDFELKRGDTVSLLAKRDLYADDALKLLAAPIGEMAIDVEGAMSP